MIIEIIFIALSFLILILYFKRNLAEAYMADLAIRRSIREYSRRVPGWAYSRFSFSKPRIYGSIEGHEVQVGASLFHPIGGGLSVSLFEKIKLNKPPHVSWTEKDSLSLCVSGENLSLEWGWLTRHHHLSIPTSSESAPQSEKAIKYSQKNQNPQSPSALALQANQILQKSSHNNIKSLLEIARQIESGSISVETQIFENTLKAHKEFLVGSIVAIVSAVFWWLVWRFYLAI